MMQKDKSKLIAAIMRAVKDAAILENKHFDEGDLFFTLAFRSDSELATIARLARVA